MSARAYYATCLGIHRASLLPGPCTPRPDSAGQIYDMVVLEVKPKDPSKAISIIETDLQIDFAPALGMPDEPECVSPTPPSPSHSHISI